VTWQVAVIYPQDRLASEGRAVFSQAWAQANGDPPSAVVMGRRDRTGSKVILRTQVIDEASGDVAVSQSCFNGFARQGEIEGVEVRFRAAGFWRRVRHRPGAILELTVAVVTFVGAITLAALTFISGLIKPTVPLWVMIAVLAVGSIVAFVRFIEDAKKAAGQ
jgi:hypothetical protein